MRARRSPPPHPRVLLLRGCRRPKPTAAWDWIEQGTGRSKKGVGERENRAGPVAPLLLLGAAGEGRASRALFLLLHASSPRVGPAVPPLSSAPPARDGSVALRFCSFALPPRRQGTGRPRSMSSNAAFPKSTSLMPHCSRVPRSHSTAMSATERMEKEKSRDRIDYRLHMS